MQNEFLLRIIGRFQLQALNAQRNPLYDQIREEIKQAVSSPLVRQSSHDDVIRLLLIALEEIQTIKSNSFASTHSQVVCNSLADPVLPSMLEIGTFGALTTVACSAAACVTSLEKDARHFAMAQAHVAQFAVAGRASVVHCDAISWLDRPKPSNISPFDLVYVDANKKAYSQYFDLLARHEWLSPSAVLVADNMYFRNLDHSNLPSRLHPLVDSIRQFRTQLSEDARFSTIFLDQISDGISLSQIVK